MVSELENFVKNIFQAVAAGILLLWSWPGIENNFLKDNQRLYILASLVAFVAFRAVILSILRVLTRWFKRFCFFGFHRLISFFFNSTYFKQYDEKTIFVPGESNINQNTQGKFITDQVFNLGVLNEVQYTAIPIPEPKGQNNKLNEYWRVGVHLSEDSNVQGVVAFRKPLIHVAKNADETELLLYKYNEDLSQEKIGLGLNANFDIQSSIEVKCSYSANGIVIRFSTNGKTIYENLVGANYKFIKFAIWTDFDEPAFDRDKDNNTIIMRYKPIYFNVNYRVEKG